MDRTEAVTPLTGPGPAPRADVASTAPVISLRGATLAYGDRVMWRDLDLDVRPGEFLAVLGPNGSGKTSLLRVLLGRLPLTAGSLEVLGLPPRRGQAATSGTFRSRRPCPPTRRCGPGTSYGSAWKGIAGGCRSPPARSTAAWRRSWIP